MKRMSVAGRRAWRDLRAPRRGAAPVPPGSGISSGDQLDVEVLEHPADRGRLVRDHTRVGEADDDLVAAGDLYAADVGHAGHVDHLDAAVLEGEEQGPGRRIVEVVERVSGARS